MATKKVEEKTDVKKKKTTKKATSGETKKATAKKSTTKKGTTKKTVKEAKTKKKVEEFEEVVEKEEELLAEEAEDKKIVVYNDEDDDDDDDDDDYDDDDDEEYLSKSNKVEKKKEKKEVIKKEESKKDAPKKKKKRAGEDSFFEQNAEIFSLIKILFGLLVVIAVVYLIVSLVNGDFKKKEKDKEDDTISEIQNDKILASSTFTRSDDEYFVLFYDASTKWGEYYAMIFENYSSIDRENVLPLYYVDLSEKLNKEIYTESNTNTTAQNYESLKVSVPTLIRIKNGKNVEYLENDEAIETLKKVINND